jgi:hypothetical protein
MKRKIIKSAAMLSSLAAGLCLAANINPGAAKRVAVRRDAPEKIQGAVYVPSDAYNAPQMWEHFNAAETSRDFGYARKIHVNALRVWASYECWQKNPGHFKAAFDQMLSTADHDGIRILISLFENCGVEPTAQNMWTTDPAKAFAIQSPGLEIAAHQEQWGNPREFLKWFMENYRNDSRLLAIEVMNEPRKKTFAFAKSMFVTAKSLQGNVPLTVGTASIGEASEFIPLGLDIIEFHDNFPQSGDKLEQDIQAALALGTKDNLPVWLTEWQWVRRNASGFDKKEVAATETTPNYASLAAIVQKYPMGNFFWSLMIKRAYLPPQRVKGTINGLFWPDGSVWSVVDGRAIAKEPALDLTERHSLPPDFLAYLNKNKND